MIKFVFFLSVLSHITFAHAQSPASSQLSELTPFLENVSKAKSPQEIDKALEGFLKKATDIAIATIEKSDSSIPKVKLEEIRQTIHDELETLTDGLYIPLDID